MVFIFSNFSNLKANPQTKVARERLASAEDNSSYSERDV